ncbi:sulfite exporter TauE/SafE family protein [Geitlerinema splendidum]|nr:sulfite exporter TauE/SafE family protein [Geitlerinema splendidum]
MDIHHWLLAVSAVTIAGLIRGFSGFGSAMAIAPTLSLIWSPQQAVAIAVLFEVAASIPLLPQSLPRTQWREILVMAIAACLTVPLGTLILLAIAPDLLRKLIAATIFLFALILLTGKRYPGKPQLPLTLGTGIASGILTGVAGIGGPPIVLYFLSGSHSVSTSRANFITYFGLTQLVALITYGFGGLLGTEIFWNFLRLMPVFLLGLGLGHYLFGSVSEKLFRYVVLIFFMAIALVSFVG